MVEDFLLKAVEWLREWFPFKIIRADEQGSFHRGGKPRGMLKPGWYWFWPGYDEIRVFNVAYQQIKIPRFRLTTADGKRVEVAISIGYTVEDAQKMDILLQDQDSTLELEAAGWLSTKLSSMEYSKIMNERVDTQAALKRSLDTKTVEWGIRIKTVYIFEFVLLDALLGLAN